MFYLVGFLELLAQEAPSQITLRKLLRGWVGELGFVEVLQQRSDSPEHQVHTRVVALVLSDSLQP